MEDIDDDIYGFLQLGERPLGLAALGEAEAQKEVRIAAGGCTSAQLPAGRWGCKPGS